MSVDHWRAGLRADQAELNSIKDEIACQSIIGALACAPPASSVSPRLPRVSVDHWRAGLRAQRPGLSHRVEEGCQSIIGALACAPINVKKLACRSFCVSRSLARWPARHLPIGEMSHVKKCQSIIGALACAPGPKLADSIWQPECQSIIGALACAPQSVLLRYRPASECQSIIGALACAPAVIGRGGEWNRVSVDHWRAGLRASRRRTRTGVGECVSRSLARWPARPRHKVKAPYCVLCQSIIGALACAPVEKPIRKARVTVCQSIIGALACAPVHGASVYLSPQRVSRSLARWPARQENTKMIHGTL